MTSILDPEAGALTAGEAAVSAELWISFVSLLRSHLGALQISGRLAQATFSHPAPQTVEVADMLRTLHIRHTPGHPEGKWQLTRLGVTVQEGAWSLHQDATASIDEAVFADMEFAVEAFARKLTGRPVLASAERAERNDQ